MPRGPGTSRPGFAIVECWERSNMNHVWCDEWTIAETLEDQRWMHQAEQDVHELGDRVAADLYCEDVDRHE